MCLLSQPEKKTDFKGLWFIQFYRHSPPLPMDSTQTKENWLKEFMADEEKQTLRSQYMHGRQTMMADDK